MRVLVTGATGTVGSAVVDCLRETDATVRAASRSPARVRERWDDGVEAVAFDFERPETWGFALEGVDRAFLVRPPALTRVGRHVNPAVDAMARTGVAHVVFLSVLGAEKNPLLPHRRIERHLLTVDLDHTFLRASFFAQNLLETHRTDVVERDEIFVPAGDGKTSFVDARDVAAVGASALTTKEHRGRAYDLTGPAALTYHEVAAVFSEALDREITYADPSVVEFTRRMRSRGHDLGFVVTMLGIYATARFGLAGRVTDDVARVLGREPRSMRTFVADHADAFR